MKIAEEKIQTNYTPSKIGDAKNAPITRSELIAADMIGLSWIFLDHPSLELTVREEECIAS